MENHQATLEKLIRFEGSIAELVASLRRFGWDSDKALVELQREDITALLNRYLHSEFAESDIEEWANAIEAREDIRYEAGHEEIIQTVLFELANPLLVRAFNRQTAHELISKL